MGIVWLIVLVLVGFLIAIWRIYQLDAKVEKVIGELIEVKTHLADISEEMDDRKNEDREEAA